MRGHHLAPVVDRDTAGSPPWPATTFLPGLPPNGAPTGHGPLPVPAAPHLVGRAATALRAVHAADVVHRDAEPGGLLLGADGPWAIGLGVAGATDSTRPTRSGGFTGTPQCTWPEHAHGRPPAPAAGVSSPGPVAAAAATGRHPHGEAGAAPLATRTAATGARPPDPAGCPAPLRAVPERCPAAGPGTPPAVPAAPPPGPVRAPPRSAASAPLRREPVRPGGPRCAAARTAASAYRFTGAAPVPRGLSL